MSRPLNMHDYRTVLLLGGPEDGRMMTVTRNAHAIHVPEATGPATAFYANDGSTQPTEVAFRTVTYHPERIYMFGRELAIFVVDGLPPEERDRLAFRHITNEKAKAVTIQ